MKLEEVTLVSCRSPFLDNDRVYAPLSNLYLHSAIQREMLEVKVNVTDNYDFENMSWLGNSTVVGISLTTPQRKEAKKLLDAIKAHNPKVKVVGGGPHVKHHYYEMLGQQWDHLVTGDGERSLITILEGTQSRVLTDVLTGVEFKELATKPNRKDNVDFLDQFSYRINGKLATSLITARGCPQKCTFCESAGTKVRRQPLPLLMEEIAEIAEIGFQGVYIFDDIFAMGIANTFPIAEKLKKHKLIYRCNGQVQYFSRGMATLLAETGCKEIAFGAESGSQRILDNIQKGTTVEQNLEFVNICKQFGIRVKAFLMLGLPGEDFNTVKETEEFIEKAGLDDFQLAIFYPYRGTAINTYLSRAVFDYAPQGSEFDIFRLEIGLGAYGQKGGESECVIRTTALHPDNIVKLRDEIIMKFKPPSHRSRWDK